MFDVLVTNLVRRKVGLPWSPGCNCVCTGGWWCCCLGDLLCWCSVLLLLPMSMIWWWPDRLSLLRLREGLSLLMPSSAPLLGWRKYGGECCRCAGLSRWRRAPSSAPAPLKNGGECCRCAGLSRCRRGSPGGGLRACRGPDVSQMLMCRGGEMWRRSEMPAMWRGALLWPFASGPGRRSGWCGWDTLEPPGPCKWRLSSTPKQKNKTICIKFICNFLHVLNLSCTIEVFTFFINFCRCNKCNKGNGSYSECLTWRD